MVFGYYSPRSRAIQGVLPAPGSSVAAKMRPNLVHDGEAGSKQAGNLSCFQVGLGVALVVVGWFQMLERVPWLLLVLHGPWGAK